MGEEAFPPKTREKNLRKKGKERERERERERGSGGGERVFFCAAV